MVGLMVAGMVVWWAAMLAESKAVAMVAMMVENSVSQMAAKWGLLKVVPKVLMLADLKVALMAEARAVWKVEWLDFRMVVKLVAPMAC